MKIFDFFKLHKNKVVVIVQCRLSSTRLPGKALLPLGGKTVLEWVLKSMKQLSADKYVLATDTDSLEKLAPFAKKCGFETFAGSREDVLDRFCKVIELTKAQTVVRATADNPFLFYEAAQELLQLYKKRVSEENIDYITFTGLPHGSGIEIFNAQSLVKAASMTSDPYDHEHVGPAIYNHQETFKALFIPSPEKYNFPELRTTIDTAQDYRRALTLVKIISSSKKVEKPYTCEEILRGMNTNCVHYPVLFVPCVQKGCGTGHLRRCLKLAQKTNADIYIPRNATLPNIDELVSKAVALGLEEYKVVRELQGSENYALIVTDLFKTDNEILKELSGKGTIVALDDGRENLDHAEYVLDIIPSLALQRKANLIEDAFIELPHKRLEETSRPSAIRTAVVSLGGEDPSHLSLPAALALAKCGIYVTLILNDAESCKKQIPQDLQKYINVSEPLAELKEKLIEYDLVVSHYGFTAFEAKKAGCAVILLGTSSYHEKLAKKYGFACLAASEITERKFNALLQNPQILYQKSQDIKELDLADFIIELSQGKKINCPICRKASAKTDMVVARTPSKTYRRCHQCGMLYLSYRKENHDTVYNKSYFYEDYQKQYGKTYIEDFASIKAQCVRRVSIMDFLYRKIHYPLTPAVLDIGCAMGPFLDAASDAGWQVYGTDVSREAVDYVQNTLHYPASVSKFPDFSPEKDFGIKEFDAVSMWYVIEHFENLDAVLNSVSKLLKKGGVFAFSTPSASGVSARFNTQEFFNSSPSDHYTLWEIKKTFSILKKYGFTVLKIVSTGHHPERFPSVKKHGWDKNSLQYSLVNLKSHILRLGDTFEVYCKKN